MTGRWWLDLVVALVAGFVLLWMILIVVLAIRRPRGGLLKESVRLLPDLLGLFRTLVASRQFPTGVRVRVALLLAYLASPIDLVPDVIPVLGYADDAIIVVLVLRSVCASVPRADLRAAWPGSEDGFAALITLLGGERRLFAQSSGSDPGERRPERSTTTEAG